MTKQKRLPQIWQISTDAFCSKVLCKSAESVGDYFFFPRNTRNSQNLQLVFSVCSVNSVGDHLSRKFCAFCVFCGRLLMTV